MEKDKVIKMFEDIVIVYDNKFKLVFSEDYGNDKKNGCIDSVNKNIIINWSIMKDKKEDDIVNFFCHEIGHNIHFNWIMNKLDELVDNVKEYNENGEVLADDLGKRYFIDLMESVKNG